MLSSADITRLLENISETLKENKQSTDLYYNSDGELLDADFKQCFECDDHMPKWIPELGVETLKSHYYGQ